MARTSRFTGAWNDIDCTCDILDKRKSIYNYVMLMFDRTNQMFEYEGLPETIPAYIMELFLQINGHVGIVNYNDNLYALPGGMGGPPDPYYRPTYYIIANPGLGMSASFKIINYLPPYDRQAWDSYDECVLVRNDTNFRGLFYIFSRYATQMTENDISIRCAQVNSRQQAFITASSDAEVAAANKYLEDLVAGKMTAVAEKSFLDGIKAANVSVNTANNIIQLIELQQYLKASWYNEIGLNANFNMKREYLSEEEIRSDTDVLIPLIDDMLYCREQAVDKINEVFGTSISVKKNSAWENKQLGLDYMLEQNKADIEKTEAEAASESEAESE